MLRSQSSQHATPPLLGQQSQEPSSKLWTRVFQAAASGSLASRAGSLMDHIGVAPGSDTREKGSGTVWVALSLSQSGLPLTGHESPSPKPAAGSLLSPVLPRAFCCHQTTISKFLKWKFGPHKPHLSPIQKDDPKVCTCGFKDEPRDAALAKTCLMFNRAVFL